MTDQKSKILFVYDMPEWKQSLWMDGLWAAIQLLEKDFEIEQLNLSWSAEKIDPIIPHPSTDDQRYDFVLGWGAFGSRVDKVLQPLPHKKGLCIGGNAMPPDGANAYDVLFYETKWYRPQINFHKHIVHAFGINSDLFNQPNLPFPIVWDYLGVGAFALWKRWERLGDKKGMRMVVGEIQRENLTESKIICGRLLLEDGAMVSDMVHPFDLANMYHWSRTLYIPADINGGGERAVLEGRACGLHVEIEDDNPKLQELLTGEIWDEKYYARQLKQGILECLI
ncbi:MAG: hypothetical protein C5B59_12860 [Bacteroidetes bacterium]|nr:MAG: hypothetical protein C5B59_12860 [Bacteroidota bacterium]